MNIAACAALIRHSFPRKAPCLSLTVHVETLRHNNRRLRESATCGMKRVDLCDFGRIDDIDIRVPMSLPLKGVTTTLPVADLHTASMAHRVDVSCSDLHVALCY